MVVTSCLMFFLLPGSAKFISDRFQTMFPTFNLIYNHLVFLQPKQEYYY